MRRKKDGDSWEHFVEFIFSNTVWNSESEYCPNLSLSLAYRWWQMLPVNELYRHLSDSITSSVFLKHLHTFSHSQVIAPAKNLLIILFAICCTRTSGSRSSLHISILVHGCICFPFCLRFFPATSEALNLSLNQSRNQSLNQSLKCYIDFMDWWSILGVLIPRLMMVIRWWSSFCFKLAFGWNYVVIILKSSNFLK